MKRILMSIIGLISLFTMVGCSNPGQDELVKYINVDLKGIATVETEVNTLYSSVTGSNFTSDSALYNKLKNEVIPKSNELITKAKAIKLEDTKLKDVHNLYIKAFTKQHEAFTVMLTSIDTKDESKMISANSLLDEARTIAAEYKKGIEDLKTEYDVVTK